MSITENDLRIQCELIQEDLVCILDGLDNRALNDICQVVVDRINILKEKLSK